MGIWTAAQTAQFLRQVRGHRLYALFHLTALRGLRRGEAAGLTWGDLDLDAGTLTVTGQLQQLGGRLVAGPPKSDAGRRVIALDTTTIAALREHRLRQQAERAAAWTRWAETGYVFTTKTGKPFGPLEPWRVGRKVTRRKSRMYNEGYFDAVHFFRYFLLDGKAHLTLKVGQQAIAIEGDFPSVNAKWPKIADTRFDPVSMLDSGDEDDVLDALAGTLGFGDEGEWDWGAEHSEDDR